MSLPSPRPRADPRPSNIYIIPRSSPPLAPPPPNILGRCLRPRPTAINNHDDPPTHNDALDLRDGVRRLHLDGEFAPLEGLHGEFHGVGSGAATGGVGVGVARTTASKVWDQWQSRGLNRGTPEKVSYDTLMWVLQWS